LASDILEKVNSSTISPFASTAGAVKSGAFLPTRTVMISPKLIYILFLIFVDGVQPEIFLN
jgi:hypothetical protein